MTPCVRGGNSIKGKGSIKIFMKCLIITSYDSFNKWNFQTKMSRRSLCDIIKT